MGTDGEGSDSGAIGVLGPAPDWLASRDWLTDPGALLEEGTFPRADTLPGQIARNKIAIHRTFGWCVPASIVFAFALYWIAVSVYAWHLLSPAPHWLDATELDHLKSMLFSSAIGALVAAGAKRYLGNEDEDGR